MKNSRTSRKPNLGVFHLSCWVLGLVAFVQLMSVGVALAMRGNVREVETKVLTEYVMVPASQTQPVKVAPPKPVEKKKVVKSEITVEPRIPDREAIDKMDQVQVLESPPPILDPVVETLVLEARSARVAGDLQLAHAKLTEAEMADPENPNIIYALGANFEAFGQHEKAAEYYQKVYRMGPLKSKSLYEKAGLKMARGWQEDVKDLASLGWGRMVPPQRQGNAERRTLVLPVTIASGREFEPSKLSPQVRFFEERDGKISPAIIKDPQTQSGSEWVTGVADWQDGEEMAEVWYLVPDQDMASGYLFGDRKFYGFVAELYYDGRLVDILAQPRTLLRTMKDQPGVKEFNELEGFDDEDFEDFGAGDSVLPRLPGSTDDDPELYGIPSSSPDLPGEEEGLFLEEE